MRRFMTFALLLILLFQAQAQAKEKDEDFRDNHNVAGFFASLNAYGSDPGYSLGLSYAYYPIQYMGIGATMSYQRWDVGDIVNHEVQTKGDIYTLDDDDDKVEKLILTVAPCLRTPSLRVGKREDMRLFLQAEPGIMLNVLPNDNLTYVCQRVEGQPGKWVQRLLYAKNHGGQQLSWLFRPSLNLGIDSGIISLGCTLSGFDPYSSRRNVTAGNVKVSDGGREHKVCAEVFASLAIAF